MFLLGAAGTAVTVEAQNTYNTGVLMRCAGVPSAKATAVLRQHALFYAAKADERQAETLKAATRSLQADEQAAPWLLPGAVEAGDEPAWFLTLETGYDPRPAWRSYRGRALFAHGGLDDSTQTSTVLKTIKGYNNPRLSVAGSPRAQHLGLIADDLCKSAPEYVNSFDPVIWNAIDRWIANL